MLRWLTVTLGGGNSSLCWHCWSRISGSLWLLARGKGGSFVPWRSAGPPMCATWPMSPSIGSMASWVCLWSLSLKCPEGLLVQGSIFWLLMNFWSVNVGFALSCDVNLGVNDGFNKLLQLRNWWFWYGEFYLHWFVELLIVWILYLEFCFFLHWSFWDCEVTEDFYFPCSVSLLKTQKTVRVHELPDIYSINFPEMLFLLAIGMEWCLECRILLHWNYNFISFGIIGRWLRWNFAIVQSVRNSYKIAWAQLYVSSKSRSLVVVCGLFYLTYVLITVFSILEKKTLCII